MKTQDLILKVLEEQGELEAGAIRRKIGLIYDTTSKHLKKMTEERLLIREARGKPWNYYYQVNKQTN